MTDKQIAWAAEVILKAICKRLKQCQENGTLSMGDRYVATLLAESSKTSIIRDLFQSKIIGVFVIKEKVGREREGELDDSEYK